MTNIDATTTNHRTLSAFKNAGQAHALQWPPVVLYLCKQPTGPYQGQEAADALRQILDSHLGAARSVVISDVTLRPWWRLWRPTRAIRITVRAMAGGFEQDFCDGGPV